MTWTEGRKHQFLISLLRNGSRKWPDKYQVKDEAKTVKKINEKTKRLAQHYRCASCQGEFPSSDVQVDHIIPVICPTEGFIDWNTYIDRLFCDKSNLQVLCTDCHDAKTATERTIKNENRSASAKPRRKRSIRSKSE